jgi:hypothetical protein
LSQPDRRNEKREKIARDFSHFNGPVETGPI